MHAAQVAGVHFIDTCREDERLTFFDIYFKVTRYIEVLGIGYAALHVLDIFNSFVPVWVKDKPWLVVELHVECGIAFIHACGDAVVHFPVLPACHRVLDTQVVGIAEGQEWAKLKRGLGVSLNKCIADEDAVLIGDENLLTFHDHATHAEGVSGNTLAVILANVLVPVGTVDITLVLVQAQVEWRAMLDHCLVERGEHHVAVVIDLGHGNHQQTVLLAGVAACYSGTVISPRLISPENLFGQRLLKIYHQVFIKF